MRVEEIDGSAPGEFGCGLVVSGRCVVVEPVLDARIDEGLVRNLGLLERGFVSRPSGVDTVINARVMDEQRRLDVLDVLGLWLGAIEGNRSAEIGNIDRKEIGDAAAVAKADDAHLAI